MSDVISFRLDKDNPREEKARRVLKAWYEKGYSLRYIMTEALLRLDESHATTAEDTTLGEVNEGLNWISRMLERIGNDKSSEIEYEEKPAESELTVGFLGMIRQAAKPCLKCDS
jgi:hypothetical protein